MAEEIAEKKDNSVILAVFLNIKLYLYQEKISLTQTVLA